MPSNDSSSRAGSAADHEGRIGRKERLTYTNEEDLIDIFAIGGHYQDSRYRYKIKLKSLGYRLAYEVRGAELLVLVVTVATAVDQGRRDSDEALVFFKQFEKIRLTD
jgi:mRNA-degrading endonuclease RelE of RelBE toxin-antitoxin system